MELMQWLTETRAGEFALTMLVSMIPVVELRGGIPFGMASLGLPYPVAFAAAIMGNILPAPFIIVYIRRVFQWMRRHLAGLNGFVEWLERKAHLGGRKVTRYKYLGLLLFVGIPLPGTGVWTGCLAAAFLDMPLRKAMPSVMGGVLLAGCIMTVLTSLGVNMFSTIIA